MKDSKKAARALRFNLGLKGTTSAISKEEEIK
jgi:hypothetical protein